MPTLPGRATAEPIPLDRLYQIQQDGHAEPPIAIELTQPELLWLIDSYLRLDAADSLEPSPAERGMAIEIARLERDLMHVRSGLPPATLDRPQSLSEVKQLRRLADDAHARGEIDQSQHLHRVARAAELELMRNRELLTTEERRLLRMSMAVESAKDAITQSETAIDPTRTDLDAPDDQIR